MDLRWLFGIILGFLFAGLSACNPLVDLVGVETVCVNIEQVHPAISASFNLPITEDIRELLSLMDLTLVEPGQSCDANLSMTLTFTPSLGVFGGKNCYFGSKAFGEAGLEVEGAGKIKEKLNGKTDTTGGTNIIRTCYSATQERIYRETQLTVLIDLMVNLWGERGTVALLDWGQKNSDLGKTFRLMYGADELSEEKAIPYILYALENGNSDVKLTAMEVLGWSTGGSGDTVNTIMGILKETEGIDRLFLDLSGTDQPADVRASAVGWLGKLDLEVEEVVEVVISLLEDQNSSSDVLVTAMSALENYGHAASAAVPSVEDLLNHEVQRVRDVATRVLKEISP